MDNLSGINDVSATSSEWVSGPTPTFISATSFSVAGDQTLTFTNGRRLKTTNTGGTIYSAITQVGFGGGITTVNVANDSGTLDSGLSAVFYGLLDPSNTSIDASHIDRKATAIASAGTTNIWGVNGNFAHITGTNTIWNFSSAPYSGSRRQVIFDGSLFINSSAAIALPGLGNISTSAGDACTVFADTVSTAIITNYTKASYPIPSFFGKAATTQVFTTSSGVYITPIGVYQIYVRAMGGGAGGGASRIGDGKTGSTTTFGPLTCVGGTGGPAGASGVGGAGGGASGGELNLTGGSGGAGLNGPAANLIGGSAGGNGFFGGGGGSSGGNSVGQSGAANTGGGGSGGGTDGSASTCGSGGGAGGYSEIVIYSPATSYAYSVGAGGAAGSGTGQAGGAGGSGVIIVRAYYYP